MKRNTRIVTIVFAMLAVLFFSASVQAATVKLKAYKYAKVTAKQIVTELKKVNKVGKTYKHEKGTLATGQVNMYKSKFSFYDKKYKDVYCSVEVFSDFYDAASRKAYVDYLGDMYQAFGQDETFPFCSFRYKNVIFRYPSAMPYKYAITYYKNIKKIVK